jgi:hypothetical protein
MGWLLSLENARERFKKIELSIFMPQTHNDAFAWVEQEDGENDR